jgi:hypothetical protein
METQRRARNAERLWVDVSPAQLVELQNEVRGTELSPYLNSWIQRYNQVGKRGEFLWKWCLTNCKLVTLPCVDRVYRDHLADTKLVHLVFLCLVDDIVDELRDHQMFTAVRALTQGQGRHVLIGFDRERRRYLELVHASWLELWSRMEQYPRWGEFCDDIRFDYDGVIRCLWHSLRVNLSPARINVAEHDIHQPANMAMVYMAMLDLTCSPEFDVAELGIAREIFLHGQMMGRVGNTIATWERELRVRDFSSGMFAYAVDAGVLNASELVTLPTEELAERIQESAVGEQVLRVWRVHHEKMAAKIERVKSVDLHPYLVACESLVATHLGGRGLM